MARIRFILPNLKTLVLLGSLYAADVLADNMPSNHIDSARFLDHVRVLASDEFEGRAPGSAGEDKTVDYLVKQFETMGIQPGNPDGSYIQQVPLMGVTSDPVGFYTVDGKRTDFGVPTEAVLASRHFANAVKVSDSEMIFAGYGVVAPEYGWDDFKGVDVRGKTIVVLVGDPPVPDAGDPGRLDDKLFKGRTMTYYGRWTYKYEIAARLGARAVLIVHDTGPAGYPFPVVINSFTGEQFDLQASDQNLGLPAVQGWVTSEKARELLADSGEDLAELKKRSIRRDFKPVTLKTRASFAVKNTLRSVNSRNVVARLEGTDPALHNEYIVFSAHWDHLGRDPKLTGSKVYHGAYDNATGVAGLLEIARGFVAQASRPKRSLLFLATTCEEQGLLGAKYYAEHPLYPIQNTLADLNLDGMNVWGRTRDVSVAGFGSTTLQDLLKAAADRQGRVLIPDAEPEKGGFFRADHFEFARVGIPVLYFHSGLSYIGKPADYGKKKRQEFTLNDYHKPSDVIKHDWDTSGAIEDLQLTFEVARAVANGDARPKWKDRSDVEAANTASARIVPAP